MFEPQFDVLFSPVLLLGVISSNPAPPQRRPSKLFGPKETHEHVYGVAGGLATLIISAWKPGVFIPDGQMGWYMYGGSVEDGCLGDPVFRIAMWEVGIDLAAMMDHGLPASVRPTAFGV